MALGSEIRAGAAFVELRTKDGSLSRGLRAAERRLKAFGSLANRVGAGLLAGGGSIVAAGLAASRVFTTMGDQLDKMSQRTGFSVESLSALGFAAEQSGADLETLEKGIRSMQRSILDAGRGLSTQVEALKKLGLQYRDLKNLSPEDQFLLIADRIADVDDPTTRAALSMQLLGRAGQQLIPMLSGGSEGIQELVKQARDLGIVVSTDAAKSAAELTDTLNITRRVTKALVFEVGGALAPNLIKAANATTSVVSGAAKWVKQNRQLVATVFTVAGLAVSAGAAIIGIGIAAQVTAFAVGGLVSIMAAAGTVIGLVGAGLAALLSPVALVSAAVIGLGALILSQATDIGGIADTIVSVFKGMASDVFGVLGSISDAIVAGDLELAVKIAGKGMQLAWQSALQGMRSYWIDFKTWFLRETIKLNMDDSPGRRTLLGIIERGGEAQKTELETEIKKLTEELQRLREQKPDTTLSDKFRDFFSSFEGLQRTPTAVDRTARGVFESGALRSLASPTESAIETHTKNTAKSAANIERALARPGAAVYT